MQDGIRDYQRARVYKWERQCIHSLCNDDPEMSLEDCRVYVREIWKHETYDRPRHVGANPPIVTDGRGRRSACAHRYRIWLPRFARRKDMLLHEIGHSLNNRIDDGHGPNFVRIIYGLYYRHLDKSPQAMQRELAHFKIDMGYKI